MALAESANALSVGPLFGSHLHGFMEQYERAYLDEVLHIRNASGEWNNEETTGPNTPILRYSITPIR
jgi:hypothetical protein